MRKNVLMRVAAMAVAAQCACLCMSAQEGLVRNAVTTRFKAAQETAGDALYVVMGNGVTEAVPCEAIDSLWFSGDADTLFIASSDTVVSRSVDAIGELRFGEMPDMATIAYEGDKARVVNPFVLKGVAITADGARVTVDNGNTAEELAFSLSGSTQAGSFTYNGSYKTTIQLNGVDITSAEGPAVNILCGKRVALNLKKGTDNRLEDAVGDHKAALYCKGHLEVDKGGSLTVKGNAKHAIATKEYMQLKNGTGAITVTGAVGDGIHAGQYFLMNGGVVEISNVAGDGIQAEVTNDETDEMNGQMMINGGELRISLTADESDALKADGAMAITTTKSVPVIEIKTTGKGSKGIKTDAELAIGDKETSHGPRLTIDTTGARSAATGTGTNTGGTWPWGGPGRPGGGGGGGWPGGGGEQSSGSSSKAIKAQGAVNVYGGELSVTTAASGAEGLESKTSVTISGGQHYFKCYDDCINSKGNITFAGGVTVCHATGNDAVDSNAGRAGAITIGDGVVLAYTSKGSPEEGLDCDNNSYIRITGNGYAISAGGAQGGGSSSSTIAGAAQGYAFAKTSISYAPGRYYTLADSQGNNLITYSFDASVNSTLSLFTAKGMEKGKTYTLKYSSDAPTDATTSFHGVYIGSTAAGTTNVTSITAQ